jgi:predicted kinase
MPVCYQMVGVPGSGKSTWIKNQQWIDPRIIVSTDVHVENYAQGQGKTYSDVFKEFMPQAVKLMSEQVVAARKYGFDVVWDQTSVNVASRRKKFNMLPDYRHIAVVLETPPMDVLKERIASRPGKNIPDHVINSMVNSFVTPTLSEGFEEIIYVPFD